MNPWTAPMTAPSAMPMRQRDDPAEREVLADAEQFGIQSVISRA